MLQDWLFFPFLNFLPPILLHVQNAVTNNDDNDDDDDNNDDNFYDDDDDSKKSAEKFHEATLKVKMILHTKFLKFE